MRMTKTNILSLATIATGIAITILTTYYPRGPYNIERQYWFGYHKTLIRLLVGIAFVLIGIAGLVKTRKKNVIGRRN